MFLWMFYFDNHPRHHYGTIRQQFWAGLHFPLHVGIVGILEGSQQIAIARSIFKMFIKLENDVHRYCVQQNLDGTALVDAIVASVNSLKLEEKLESKDQAALVIQEVTSLANVSGICSVANTTNLPGRTPFPATFSDIMVDVFGALFQATGINLPKNVDPSELAGSTFITVYIYYWAAIWLTFTSFAALFWLTRHKERRAVIFDRIAISSRVGAAIVGAIGGIVAASKTFLYHYIRSPAILPTVTVILFVVLCCDRVGRQLSVRRLKKQVEDDGFKLSPLNEAGYSGGGYVRTPSVESRR
jgi:hypothetical protein